MKKVALLTTFYEVDSGYSLIGVAETQLKMLLDHGYDPIVLVQENIQETEKQLWQPSTLDIRPVIPALALSRAVAADFSDRVNRIYQALEANLKEADVVIAHDIILQDFYKEHNIAMRRFAKENPDILWLHWIHSCPSAKNVTSYPDNCRYSPPPGYIVYPNATDQGFVCQAYGLAGQEWRVKVCRAGHIIDPLDVWPYSPLTRDLARAADLLSGDVVAVYPARLDRGKQPEKIIRLMAGVQAAGYEPRLLIIDWQSGGDHFQAYKDELQVLANELAIGRKINFTSRLDDRADQGVPRPVVMELMDLSNVYIHPSRVETYSLVVHEAMLRGKLVALNHDFPAMRELFGQNAIYFDFESDRHARTYEPDEQAFWDDEAKRLIAELRINRALMAQTRARQAWTPAALWQEFEALFYLESIGEKI